MTFDLLIIGSGLEAADAATIAADQGKRVAVAPVRGHATTMWPGFFDVFGPTGSTVPPQLPTRFRRGTSSSTAARVTDPQRRLDRLAATAPDHPYAALGFDAARVRDAFRARIERLGIPGTFHYEPVLVATSLGTVRYADFTCEGLGVVDGVRTRFVGLDALPQWSPEWAAKLAGMATGAPHDTAWAATDDPLAETSLRIAAAWNRSDDARVAQIAKAADGVAAFVPPVLGTTFEARREAGRALAAAGADVAEIGGGADSAFGLRLAAHLTARVDAVATRVAELIDAPVRDGSGWTVRAGEDTVTAASLRFALDDDVAPSWAEPWLEPAARPPRNAADSPWGNHAFVRRIRRDA